MTQTSGDFISGDTSFAHFVECAKDIKRHKLVDSVVQGFGLDSWEIDQAWSSGYGQDRLPDGTPNPEAITWEEYRTNNLARLLQLESTHSGGGEMLRRLNGIRSFGRSSAEMLQHMCDDRHRAAARVVLFTVAIECRNGAMQQMHEYYENLRAAAPSDVAFVFTETGEMGDFGFSRARVVDHGSDAEVHAIFASGHGDRHGMDLRFHNFGRSGHRWRFEQKDVGTFLSFLGDIAIPQTTVALGSCSTGKGNDSFAQTINQQSGLCVLAPVDSVGVKDLQLHDRDDVLELGIKYAVRYAKGNTWKTRPSPTRIFAAASGIN